MTAPRDGKVYFAKCFAPDGYDLAVVKIGCSDDPESRVKSVKTGQPFSLELVATMKGDMFMEHFVHMWLRADRLTGEFFHLRGTTSALVAHVAKHGKPPFPVSLSGPEGWFNQFDLVSFMKRHGISLADIRASAGVTCNGYENLLKKDRCGNRRFLAALSVTAVKRGIPISYPVDFMPQQAAA